MKSVYMLPALSFAVRDTTNAILQVITRLAKTLPAHGWQLTEDPQEADIVAGHAGMTDGKYPVDIAHVHGLMPTAKQPSPTDHAINAHVIHNIRCAQHVTVPSEWVADILRRDMHINPHVVGWAIDYDEWEPGENAGYVLWNKTRDTGVCDPSPLLELAKRLPEQSFVTTFGSGPANVQTIGRQPFATMQGYIRNAGVYLATTRETFGIGTLEAMACGVPVLGYDWAGTADLIRHGETGYLAKPGNIDDLLNGLQYCLTHRDRLGANGRAFAKPFTWDRVALQFARIYDMAAEPHEGPLVSVVIPVFNYGRYVDEAIRSVQAQETSFDVEIIVVDDHSTDNSIEVARQAIDFSGHVLQTAVNSGPAVARNIGIQVAQGRYICALDADDRLGDTHYLQTMVDALEADRTLGIAYSSLQPIDAAGNTLKPSMWPDGFDFEQQLTGKNQIPTCCVYRKTAWERAGGYRSNVVPAEDADLWLRMGLAGFNARHVTTAPMFHYRIHQQSLTSDIRSQHKVEPQWAHQHRRALTNRPFASMGKSVAYPVHDYDQPEVSVIIPVGPGHERYLPEALDSVEGQTFWNWECIVVFDSDYDIAPDELTGYPWAKFHWNTGPKHGAGAARNVGIQAARGKYLAFLDADDLWRAEYLEHTLKTFRSSGRYVYTDWIAVREGEVKTHTTPEFTPEAFFRQPAIHTVSVLIPRADVLAVGGFDEDLPSWEDADFFMKLVSNGYCGKRLNEPLLIYRYQTGSRREDALKIEDQLKATLRQRYSKQVERGDMSDCGCGSGARINKLPAEPVEGDMVRVQYYGEGVPAAAAPLRGFVTQQMYGRRKAQDVFMVWKQDYEAMRDVLHPFYDFDVPDMERPSLAGMVGS